MPLNPPAAGKLRDAHQSAPCQSTRFHPHTMCPTTPRAFFDEIVHSGQWMS